jgi:hypothetical protein
MRKVFKVLKWMLIIMVVSSIIGVIIESNDKYSKLESYIDDRDFVAAKELIDDLEKSSDGSARLVYLKSYYYEAQELYDNAAEELLTYYSTLENKEDFSDSFVEKLESLKGYNTEAVVGRIDEVMAEITALKEARSAEEREKENQEKKKEADRLLEDAISDGDRAKLTELYQPDLQAEQKEKLISELDQVYKEWVGTKYAKLSSGSIEDIEAVHKELRFLDRAAESDFSDLKEIRSQLEILILNQKEENKLKTQYGSDVQYVDVNTVDYLDVYVINRVESATNLNIAGFDLTDKYTDQYQATSYEVAYGVPVPTGDWQGVIMFENSAPSSAGVVQTMVSYVGSQNFVDAQGFKKELPVYIAITQDDIWYSEDKNYFDEIRRAALESIETLL